MSLSHAPEPKEETVHRNARAWVAILFAAVIGLLLSTAPNLCAQARPATATVAELRIGGEVSTPLVLTVADVKKMPRKTLSVVNAHDHKTETYEGVLLEELLKRAGVAQGEKLRGALMAAYVIAEAGMRGFFLGGTRFGDSRLRHNCGRRHERRIACPEAGSISNCGAA